MFVARSGEGYGETLIPRIAPVKSDRLLLQPITVFASLAKETIETRRLGAFCPSTIKEFTKFLAAVLAADILGTFSVFPELFFIVVIFSILPERSMTRTAAASGEVSISSNCSVVVTVNVILKTFSSPVSSISLFTVTAPFAHVTGSPSYTI